MDPAGADTDVVMERRATICYGYPRPTTCSICRPARDGVLSERDSEGLRHLGYAE
jgi:hypothetical protein